MLTQDEDLKLPLLPICINADTIRYFNQAAKETLFKKRSAKLLMTYSFHAFPLFQFARRIWTVSEHNKDQWINEAFRMLPRFLLFPRGQRHIRILRARMGFEVYKAAYTVVCGL